MATMSLEDAVEVIRKADKAAGTMKPLIDAAMDSHRLDVLAFCWEDTTYGRYFFQKPFLPCQSRG